MPDGSIRISTRIDNSKLNGDLKETTRNIKQIESDINKNANNVGKMTAKYNETNQKIKENETLLKNIINDTRTIVETDNQIIRMSDENAKKILETNEQYQSLLSKTAELYNNAEQYKNKIAEGNKNIEGLRNKLGEAKAQQEIYKKKVEETKNKQKELNYSTNEISKPLNKGISKILKYGAALLSIRSIYGLITSAMNSWLNGNNSVAKQLKSDIDYMKNAIGRALSPVLKYIVNLLYQALGLAGALIKAFTGIDIFAGSVADYMESTTSSANKTNKELKKQLTSFDKINKLDDNSSSKSGSSGGTIAPSQDLSSIMNKYTEFAEKVKKIFDEVKDLIPIIGAGILAWKLSDLFFSQLEGLDSLKAKVGLTLIVTGLSFWYQGVSGFREGELTGENILKMVAGAIAVGVGAGILTLSATVGIGVSAILLTLGGYVYTVEYGKNNTLIGAIGQALGIDEQHEFIYSIATIWDISVKIIGYENLEAAIFSNMKSILKAVADWVEKIPFIGKSIANGIRSAIKASETDTTNTIKYSTKKSLEDANPWVKGIAEKNGKETRRAYQGGYSSLTDETSNVISDEQTKAIDNASKEVNRHAYSSGQSEAQSINSGIASESLSQGINALLNTGRNALNNSNMSLEGQKVGATVETGYASNSLNGSTQRMVNDAKNVLNNNNLNSEGQNLSKTAGQGIKDGSWAITKESRNAANQALSSFESVNGLSSGANLVAGIARGIKNNRSKVVDALAGLANGAISAFNIALGIHSPSRVFANQAKFIPLGIAEGVDSTSDKAVDSMKNLVFGMQETVDDLDYSNVTQIPRVSKNAVSYVPKQAISTNEIQRTIVGEDSNLLNKLLSSIQSNSNNKKTITVPLIIDGEEFIRKTIELNGKYNLATNGGGW